MNDFRQRLTNNANDFDTIVSDILTENEKLKSEIVNLRSFIRSYARDYNKLKAEVIIQNDYPNW